MLGGGLAHEVTGTLGHTPTSEGSALLGLQLQTHFH